MIREAHSKHSAPTTEGESCPATKIGMRWLLKISELENTITSQADHGKVILQRKAKQGAVASSVQRGEVQQPYMAKKGGERTFAAVRTKVRLADRSRADFEK